MPERLNGRDWKSRNGGNLVRGFESLPLRPVFWAWTRSFRGGRPGMRHLAAAARRTGETMAPQSLSSMWAGSVVARKSPRTAASPSGSSRLGKWAARGSVSKRLLRRRAVGGQSVGEGDCVIALAPDDQGRHAREQVEPVGGADSLAVDVDHGAERVQERGARAGLLERA